MPVDLDAIRRRLAAATTYPWCQLSRMAVLIVPAWQRDRPFGGSVDEATDRDRYAQPVCKVCESRHRSGVEVRANADLIAHAPEDLAALLGEVERLRAELQAQGGGKP